MDHTVLFVDDDPNLLHSMARYLRSQPYQIYTARSAEEAKNVIITHDVDVAILDEEMPGGRGSELAGWIVHNQPDIRRIILTGKASVESAIRAINEGEVSHYFTKPCDVLDMALAIRRAIEERDHELHRDVDVEAAGQEMRPSIQVLFWHYSPEGLLSFQDVFDSSAFSVTVVTDETDVFQQMEALRPDIALWEVASRESFALALCRRLAQQAKKTDTAVIPFFRRSDDSLIPAMFECGAADCLFPEMGDSQIVARLLAASHAAQRGFAMQTAEQEPETVGT